MKRTLKISGAVTCDGTERIPFDKMQLVVRTMASGKPLFDMFFYKHGATEPFDDCLLCDAEQNALCDLLYGYNEWLKTGKENDFIFNTTQELEGITGHELCWFNAFYEEAEKLAIYIFNSEGDKLLDLVLPEQDVEKLFKAIKECVGIAQECA